MKFTNDENGVTAMAQYLKEQILENNPEKYNTNDELISVIFLAWAPWAGKTEWIEWFPDHNSYIILDTDHYRSLFEWYKGSNAWEYQKNASRVMDKMYNFCMKEWYNVIVDGTFWNQSKVSENITKCKKHSRTFSVVLVFQDPVISFLFTKKREQEKLRNIPTPAFIEKFFQSIQSVQTVILEYPDTPVFVSKKLKSEKWYFDQYIESMQQFDSLVNLIYSKEELIKLIYELDQNCKDSSSLNTILWHLIKPK